MNHIVSYVLSNSYGAFSPSLNAVASVCTVNGQQTNCPDFLLPVFSVFFIIALVVGLLTLIGGWKVFTKAGKPGWAILIPIYNIIVLLEIVRKPIWWIILYFIPIVSIVINILVYYELAKSFGKGGGYTVGLILLPFIFIPMLGFGDAQYINTQVPMNPTPTPTPTPTM